LISDLTRIRTISEMNRSLGWGDRPRRLNARRAQKRPARTTSLAVTGASSNATLPLWDWQGCTAMPRGVGPRSMSGNGSVRKKVDLIWSVVSSRGDSALEGDRECVQGWFRALCLSKHEQNPAAVRVV
jgi:hypothetical protein